METDNIIKGINNEKYIPYDNEDLHEDFNDDILENVTIKHPIEFPSVWTPEKARVKSVNSDVIPLKSDSKFKTVQKPQLNPFSDQYRSLFPHEKMSRKDVEMTIDDADKKQLVFDTEDKERSDINISNKK